MEKTIISGMGIITPIDNGRMIFEFHPDNPEGQELPVSATKGNAQLMHSGDFSFMTAKKRIRNNDLLIRKAAHGRLSGTRDGAWQLTLKCFASEGIDWQRAFVREAVELITCLMGEAQMCDYLGELTEKLNSE